MRTTISLPIPGALQKNSLRDRPKFPAGVTGIYRETRGFRRVPGALTGNSRKIPSGRELGPPRMDGRTLPWEE